MQEKRREGKGGEGRKRKTKKGREEGEDEGRVDRE